MESKAMTEIWAVKEDLSNRLSKMTYEEKCALFNAVHTEHEKNCVCSYKRLCLGNK